MSVSLDEKSIEIIGKLQEEKDCSKSEVFREALKYLEIITEKGEVSKGDLWAYLDFLREGEHLIIDIATWKSFFSDVEKHSENFWEKTFEIGEQHWSEYKDKGIDDVEGVLDYIERSGCLKSARMGREPIP